MNCKSIAALVLMIGINSACGETTQETSNQSAMESTLPACLLAPHCQQSLPLLPKPTGFSGWYNNLITKTGKPLHRGRDVIAIPGAPIWIQAKFTYGKLDADLRQEKIDIYLSQNCTSGLKKIGQGFTTLEGEHEMVDGVEDSGGRLYMDLSTLGIKKLPIGRHRVVLVVPGDNSMTELYITIVDPKQKIAVIDVDGTLTGSELAAAAEILGGQNNPRPGSVNALHTLVAKGYHIVYLTARPEWLGGQTRTWLAEHGFPLGTLRTTTFPVGIYGEPAIAFKSSEIKLMEQATGIIPSIALGNKATDVWVFSKADIPGAGSYYHELNADLEGGSHFSDYADLEQTFQTLPKVCR